MGSQKSNLRRKTSSSMRLEDGNLPLGKGEKARADEKNTHYISVQ